MEESAPSTSAFPLFNLLIRQWFLFLLVGMLAYGLCFPALGVWVNHSAGSKPFIFVLLLIAGMGMKGSQVIYGFKSYKSIILTLSVTYMLLPTLLVWAAAYIGMTSPLGIGLLVLAATPTTLGSGTIYTRLSNGNAELALALTIIGNTASCILSPMVLLVVFMESNLPLSFLDMVFSVLMSVILPLALGQIVVLISGNFILKLGPKLDILSRVLLAGVILMGASQAAAKAADLSFGNAVLLLLLCGLAHCLAVLACDFGGRTLRLNSADRIACMFVGGQKSLPVALSLLLALYPGSEYALAVLPLVLFHALSLILDSMLAELFRRDMFVMLNSIQSRIASSASACVLIAIGMLVAFNVSTARKTGLQITEVSIGTAEVKGKEKLLSDASGIAAAVKIQLEEPLTTVRALAGVLSGIKTNRVNLDMNRETIITLLRGVLESNSTVRGIYTVWGPNALDDLDNAYMNTPGHDATGRFAPGWWRGPDGQITLAPVGGYDDPSRAGNGESRDSFYRTPMQSGHEAVLNPSAPKVGSISPEPVISFVVPIVAESKNYGIVGIDIPIGAIQALCDAKRRDSGKDAPYMRVRLMGANNARVVESRETAAKSATQVATKPTLQPAGEPGAPSDAKAGAAKEDLLSAESSFEIGATKTHWSVAVEMSRELVLAPAKQLGVMLSERNDSNLRTSVFMGLLAVIAVVIALWMIAGAVAGPIRTITNIAKEVARGDLISARQLSAQTETRSPSDTGSVFIASPTVQADEGADETRQLMNAIQAMTANLNSVVGINAGREVRWYSGG